MSGTINDPNDYSGKLRAELARLNGLTNRQDAEAIRTWANSQTTAPSTRITQTCYLRKFSEHAEAGGYPALTEIERIGDFYALHDSIRDGSNPNVKDDGLAESTLRTMRNAARKFFKFLNENADDYDLASDYAWHSKIKIGGPQKTSVTEYDIFAGEEIQSLLDACRNPRDKALIATLAATGQRISALLSLRVRDVTFTGSNGFLHLNENALGLKGASGKRPLLWATEYMKNWLDIHPYRQDGNAVFCALKEQDHPHRSDDAQPLTTWSVNQQLRRIRDRAGVRKPVNPHNFRHTAITLMVREGLSDSRIKWMVGWGPDSTQFDRYTHLRDDEMMAGVLEHFDLAEEDHSIGRPTFEKCPSCRAILSEWMNPVACPGCGLALSHTAASLHDAVDTMHTTVTDAAIESTDPSKIALAQLILEETADPEEMVAWIAEKIEQNPQLMEN